MSEVYRGYDLVEDATVAIKVLDTARQATTILRESFKREVEILSRLRHPHVIQLLGSGEATDDRPFLVLEWAERSLQETKGQQKTESFLGWDSFAEDYALPILDGLAYAHSNGVCHRDLKPANILVASDQSVRVADFGIAKLKSDLRPGQTLNEFVSRPFCAPELDDGINSYSRDVFAFGALCVWALADAEINSYEELDAALETFDAPPEVTEIIARCLARDPESRPDNATLLAIELNAVQRVRAAGYDSRPAVIIPIGLTNKAKAKIAEVSELPLGDESGLRGFIERDINDAPSVSESRQNDGEPHYIVFGGQYTYRLAAPRDGFSALAMIDVMAKGLDRHMGDKVRHASVDATFRFGDSPGALAPGPAIDHLRNRVLDNAVARAEAAGPDAVVSGWLRTLEMRKAYSRDQTPPIDFSRVEVQGSLVRLYSESDLTAVQTEQPWRIRVGDDSIRGHIAAIGPDWIELYVQGAASRQIPSKGRAELDTRALDIALNRQRTALLALANGSSVRPDLSGLLADPGRSRENQMSEPQDFSHLESQLDSSKQEAIRRSFAVDDFLVVQGPPGTGKTRFIAHLVYELLRREPRSKILLSSQTHVAIDNAIERIAQDAPEIEVLRIAREDSPNVADSSSRFLLDNAMKAWRDSVEAACRGSLEELAAGMSMDPEELRLGVEVEGILRLLEEVERTNARLKSLAARGLELKDEAIESASAQDEFEQLRAEAVETKTQLDVAKDELSRDLKRVKASSPQAAELLSQSREDIRAKVAGLLPRGTTADNASDLVRLQGEWLQRFGRDDSFTLALAERVQVVAGTCIGLAGLDGFDQLEFDICILDEAGKAHATEAVVPLVSARKWVLVGDRRQLPPHEDEALRNPTYRERFNVDDEESLQPLFDRLDEKLPDAHKVTLDLQYRMVPPIGDLISECFYEGAIRSAPRELDPVLSSVFDASAVWISTHGLAGRHERHVRGSFDNPLEVEKVIELLNDLEIVMSQAKRRASVLCLSGYSGQVRAIAQAVRSANPGFSQLDIECNTIDAVQGREADVVLFSVTRSNPEGRGGFLKEFRRMNVALSRARETLVIVGDQHFVSRADGLDSLRRVFDYLRQGHEHCQVQEFQA